MDKLYHYRAHVLSVYDGDTATLDFDLGMKMMIKKERVRLSRINAPEVRGKEKVEGKLSRDFLKSIILGKDIIVKTLKDKKGKYGRYIVEIQVEIDGNMINVSDLMVSEGHAIYKEY